MPFIEHLAELRTRLIHITLAVIVGSLIAYSYSSELFAFLTHPIRAAFSKLELIGIEPMEAFVCKLKGAVAAGVLLASPYCFYQLWIFISPGLHEHERRFALPFIAVSTLCFVSGTAFCYYAVLPFALDFFAEEYLSIGLAQHIQIGKYLAFVIRLCLVFGGVFELPILFFFLARLKLVSHHWLKKNFRYAVVIIFIAAGVLTPSPDMTTQLLLAGPLLVIYGLCILIAYYAYPKSAEGAAS